MSLFWGYVFCGCLMGVIVATFDVKRGMSAWFHPLVNAVLWPIPLALGLVLAFWPRKEDER